MNLVNLDAGSYSVRRDSELSVLQVGASHVSPRELTSYIHGRNGELLQLLSRNGAVLIRGGCIATLDEFEALWLNSSCFAPWQGYPFMESSRMRLGRYAVSSNYTQRAAARNGIYAFHRENSFLPRGFIPDWLAFCCLRPSARGGETALVNVARVLDALPQSLRRKLEGSARRTIYGMSEREWRRYFGTFDMDQLRREAHARGANVAHVTRRRVWLTFEAPYIERHRTSGISALHYERRHVWGELWRSKHYRDSFLPHHTARVHDPWWRRARSRVTARALDVLGRFRETHLALDADEARALVTAWADHTVAVPYQKGDVLLVDNHLMEHTALPWSGERHLAVVMGNYSAMNGAATEV